MQLRCNIAGRDYHANLSEGIDISQGFGPGGDNAAAFHIDSARIEPIRVGDFVGSVTLGSGANCEVVTFCAHGNGTHTECLGHITAERHAVHRLIGAGFYTALLKTVKPKQREDDYVIGLDQFEDLNNRHTDAIILRTEWPMAKRGANWSGKNPPYYEPAVLTKLADMGFIHFLTDLPSVDREEDGGALSSHHRWWKVPEAPRTHAGITELIVVPDDIPDGLYAMNLQFPPIESDAAPSRPVLYRLIPA